jgi:hypothetical protein
MRAAAGRPATLRWQLTDDVGDVLTPDGNVVVKVYAGDGVTVVAGPTNATYDASNKVFVYTLPGQAQLDSLTAQWSCLVGGIAYNATTQIDIIGQRLVDPFILRQDSVINSVFTGLGGAMALVSLMDQIEQGISSILGYPVVLEGFREQWDTLRGTLNDALYVSGTVNGLPYGWGAGKMLIPQVRMPVQIYAGSVNGVTMDPTNDVAKLLVQTGALVWSDYRPWISGRYSMWGTHGDPNPSEELRRVAAKLVKHWATTTSFPDRAFSITTEGAQIMFSMPTPERPTGIPEVDGILNRIGMIKVI